MTGVQTCALRSDGNDGYDTGEEAPWWEREGEWLESEGEAHAEVPEFPRAPGEREPAHVIVSPPQSGWVRACPSADEVELEMITEGGMERRTAGGGG